MLFFVSCKKDESIWQVKNLNPNNKTLAFGHGGMGVKYRYPMNSMESLKRVLAIGSNGTEMDLQLSKDNVLVLFHNTKLEDATNGKGLVRNKTWDEIKNTEYKWPLFDKTKLIRIQDYFDELVPDANHIFTFDCKVEAKEDQDYLNNFVKVLYNFIVTNKLEENCFIESYNLEFLKSLSALNGRLKLFVHSNNYQDGYAIAKEVKLYGITLDRINTTKEEIQEAHAHNLRIALFNMANAQENIKAIQMNADFLQSDKMAHLIDVVSK
jgi:glycerophosphoryl diester phosphodiesterase